MSGEHHDMSYQDALAHRLAHSGRIVAFTVIDRQRLRDAIRQCLAVFDAPDASEQDMMRAMSRMQHALEQSESDGRADDMTLDAEPELRR